MGEYMTQEKALPTWDLTDLYPSHDSKEFKQDLISVGKNADRFEKEYKGKLTSLSPEEFAKMLKVYEDNMDTIQKIGSYSGLLYTTNLDNSPIKKFVKDSEDKMTDDYSKYVFFNLEINDIPDDKFQDFLKHKDVAKYKPYLEEVRKMKPHQLSDEMTKFEIDKNKTGSGVIVRIYDEARANMTFNIDGKEYADAEMDEFFHSSDPEVRAKAGKEINRVTKQNEYLFTIVTNTVAQSKDVDDKWHKFDKPVSARNLSNNVEDEVVEALATSVKNNYADISHRFYDMKAEWLGLDKLEYWDRNAPLPFGSDKKYSWDEAKKIVLDAYREFSPEMSEIAQKFFDNNWIDGGPRKGKESGAYAMPCNPKAHPYVMLNFQGTANDVSTMAHELGHGIHQYLSREQGALMADTPLTLAETASIFGEMLTFKSLLAKETDPKARLALLAGKSADMINTAMRQIAFHEYETEVHNKRKEGELESKDISAIWKDKMQAYLGPKVNYDDNSSHMWAQLPHAVHTPFYVYAYSFADCLVNSMYKVYEEKKVDNFQDKYVDMLSKGGSEGYKDMLKPFGLDASKPDFWNKGLGVLKGFVDDMEKISEDLGLTKPKNKSSVKNEAIVISKLKQNGRK